MVRMLRYPCMLRAYRMMHGSFELCPVVAVRRVASRASDLTLADETPRWKKRRRVWTSIALRVASRATDCAWSAVGSQRLGISPCLCLSFVPVHDVLCLS